MTNITKASPALDTPAMRELVTRLALEIDPAAKLEEFPEALAFQIDMARAVIRASLPTHPAPGVPDGWRITDDGDGSITIKGPGKIGCNVSDDEPYGARIFGDVLHALCRAMLAAAQAEGGEQ